MTSYLSQKIRVISFLSIIMVVVLHCYNLDTKQNGVVLHFDKDYNWFFQNLFSYGITRIAVPLFFMISGYLFYLGFTNQKGVLIDKIKKRIKTIVIPYFFWTVTGVLFYFVMQSIPKLQPFFNKKLVKNYSFSDWMNAIFVDLVPYQLWFLRDLILLVFASALIYYIIKKTKFLLPFISFCFWIFNQSTIFLSSESILFFSIGATIALYYPEYPTKLFINNKIASIWIVLLVSKIIVLYFNQDQKIIINIIHKTSILIGLLSVWSLYDIWYPNLKEMMFKRKTLLDYSFFIYVFHEPLLTIVKKSMFLVMGKKELSYFIIYCISPFIIISSCLIAGHILKKYFNKFYNFSTGYR